MWSNRSNIHRMKSQMVQNFSSLDGVNLLFTQYVQFQTSKFLSSAGATRGGGSLPQRLQIITLNAVSTKRCREIYGGGNVHDSHICTFNGRGQGACNGDSGGPLVYQDKVVGVVNFGVPCAVCQNSIVELEFSDFSLSNQYFSQ